MDPKHDKEAVISAGPLAEAYTATEDGTQVNSRDSVGGVAIGHVELERNFGFWDCIGIALTCLNSITAMSASLSLVLPSGGPVAMLYGLIVSATGTLCMAASLAEICHVYPTSGGQYEWVYILAPEGWKNGLSFVTGWMATAGWVSLAATGSSLGANFIVGIIAFWHPEFEAQPYQTFLIYLGFTIGAFLLNTFAVRLLPMVDRTAFWWALGGALVVIITILSTARGHYQPASFVFATFQNETGWPAGVAFILGLLQSTFGLTGFDGISHMIEEMPRPSINAPKTMVLAVFLGAVSSWIFVLVLLFCLTDFTEVIESTAGPLLTIYYQATRSMAGATCLLMFNVLSMAFATQGLMTIASRMTMAVARDRLFGRISTPFTKIHPTLKVPTWSILFVSGWVVVFGLIFLGSSAALNAILSASVVLVQISYIITIALVLFRGNSVLEPPGYPRRIFTLGKFRPFINVLALIFAIVTSVFFVFPGELPVSGTSMNYVIVVIAIVTLMCAVTWIVDGRKHFTGPRNIVIYADVEHEKVAHDGEGVVVA